MKAADLTGQAFGRLTAEQPIYISWSDRRHWRCRCECGNTVTVRATHLKSGATQSCGCLQAERTSAAQKKHGETGSIEYHVWVHIKGRCFNMNDAAFASYGGRGITMCDRWRHSFEAFLSDMGRRPARSLSIDRINNDGPYSPENCRWATRLQQRHNQRAHRLPPKSSYPRPRGR